MDAARRKRIIKRFFEEEDDLSESTSNVNQDTTMKCRHSEEEENRKVFNIEDNTSESIHEGNEDPQEVVVMDRLDKEGTNTRVTEDNFLAMLLNSAGDGESLFTSWELGK